MIVYYDRGLATNSTEGCVCVLLNNKGNALDSLGKYEEAISNYDKVLTINPSDSDGLYNKGITLHNLGKYVEAITYYDKALATNSTDFSACNCLLLNHKGTVSCRFRKI